MTLSDKRVLDKDVMNKLGFYWYDHDDVRETVNKLIYEIEYHWDCSSRCRDIDETWLNPTDCIKIINKVFGKELCE